ncbi:hypothetical protein TNCV_781021 [Trichonephila clavipes]|nr:hypothetical protein TNCV_781021 [Trichonephila clavipes]
MPEDQKISHLMEGMAQDLFQDWRKFLETKGQDLDKKIDQLNKLPKAAILNLTTSVIEVIRPTVDAIHNAANQDFDLVAHLLEPVKKTKTCDLRGSHDLMLGWDFFKATDDIIDCGSSELQIGNVSPNE